MAFSAEGSTSRTAKASRRNARTILLLIGLAHTVAACSAYDTGYTGAYPPPDIGTRASATRWSGP